MKVSVKQGKIITILVSLAIPLLVIILHYMPKTWAEGKDLSFMPLGHAIINGTTFVLLIFGLIAIKKKKVEIHRKIMWTCLVLSVMFLLSYVVYHSGAESVKFCKEGAVRYIYFFILLTHILLSGAIVPLVLITLFRALTERYDKHRKLAKITFPIWLYVALTGVLVYVLVAPCY